MSLSADQIRNRYKPAQGYVSRYNSSNSQPSTSFKDLSTEFGGYATQQEKTVIDKTMETNAVTTDLAKEAAKIATQIVEVADSTTVELHRQQQVLDEIEDTQEQIREDTKVAEHAATYVSRKGCWWWLFSCCCACDPHDKENMKNRQVELRHRDLQQAAAADQRAATLEGQKAAAQERKDFHVEALSYLNAAPAPAAAVAEEGGASGSAHSASGSVTGVPQERGMVVENDTPKGTGIGESSAIDIPDFLPEDDKTIFRQQFQEQDDALDLVSAALDHLQSQANEWNDILQEQAGRLERIEANNDEADVRFKNVTKVMKKA